MSQRARIRLFVRIKDLRDINAKAESFRCRFRLFAYYDDALMEAQLTADEKATLVELAERKFKVPTERLSREAVALLPTLSIGNKVDVSQNGAAEFMVKPKPAIGFNFCFTVQYDAVLSHEYDVANFPFDHHALPIEFGLKKAADIKRFQLEVGDDGGTFQDPEESIPFHREAEERPWMPDEWRAHAQAPFELERFDSAEWVIHTGGGALQPWDSALCDAKKPRVSFLLHVTRRHQLYFHDVMLLNSLIITTAFCSPAGKLEFNERFANDLVLLLTTVALKIAAASNLPVVPYATYTSMHFNAAIATMFLITVMHAIESGLGVRQWVDIVAHGAAFALWVAYHCALAGILMRRRRTERASHGPTIVSVYEQRNRSMASSVALWFDNRHYNQLELQPPERQIQC